jgi:hypothetical protein
MTPVEALLDVCKRVSRILDTLPYECSGRKHTLDDDAMSWVFYCRDLCEDVIRQVKKDVRYDDVSR